MRTLRHPHLRCSTIPEDRFGPTPSCFTDFYGEQVVSRERRFEHTHLAELFIEHRRGFARRTLFVDETRLKEDTIETAVRFFNLVTGGGTCREVKVHDLEFE